MLRFLVRRSLFALLVLWIVVTSVFVLFFVAPSNAARSLAGKQATPEIVAQIKHRLGLDQSIWTQYVKYLGRLVHGDLGYSYYSGTSVNSIIQSRLPVTASLAIGGAIIWLVLGVTMGVLAATRPRSIADRAATVFALVFYSMPTFLLGILFLYFLFFRLHLAGLPWFSGGGYTNFTSNPIQWAHQLILPWLTLALVSATTYVRLTRGSLLEVLGEDYIRTARAKGLKERRVVYRHGLRAALTPIVTQFGIDLGTLLGGAIVTEQVFALPGLGKASVDAITTQDQPVIIGITIVAAVFIVVANVIVDALYAVLDPRVRVS